jgi:hypothetical protein
LCHIVLSWESTSLFINNVSEGLDLLDVSNSLAALKIYELLEIFHLQSLRKRLFLERLEVGVLLQQTHLKCIRPLDALVLHGLLECQPTFQDVKSLKVIVDKELTCGL